VRAGQHQVEQHHIGLHALHAGHREVAATDQVDLEAVRLEIFGRQARQTLVVLDIQHPDRLHTSSIALRAARSIG
jgi:hypothetical protein